jgi:TolA-binding protein
VAQAIRIFGDLIEQFPNGATVPDALYMVGLSQDRLGNTSRAVETLARLKTIYPATEAGKRAAEALSGRPQSL